jgi:tyrosyl-tRNA synthetase
LRIRQFQIWGERRKMEANAKLQLITKEPTEEVITEGDLRELLETNPHPSHYIGFEISGLLHLGTLIVSGTKINDLIKAGVDCTVYLADWHSFINNKFGRDWDRILTAAKYYEEAFRFFCPGVKIVYGSDLYHNNDSYWKDVVRFSTHMTLQRALRAVTIMGRSERETLDLAQLLYPSMQGTDVKYLGEDMPHGGTDQRKIHVLAREIFPKLGWKSPVPIHHHLLMGLAKPERVGGEDDSKLSQTIAAKMSKSKPWTAIFIHDSEEGIESKLRRAWCPEKETEMNPVLELARYIIFRYKDKFEIERAARYGGDQEFASYKELEEGYARGEIHPSDLKANISRAINDVISPIRSHFEKPKSKELLDVYKGANITR